jgi:hypothetical protein
VAKHGPILTYGSGRWQVHLGRIAQRRDGEAKQILAPVCERFTDGYETTDLRAARIMLDTLPT